LAEAIFQISASVHARLFGSFQDPSSIENHQHGSQECFCGGGAVCDSALYQIVDSPAPAHFAPRLDDFYVFSAEPLKHTGDILPFMDSDHKQQIRERILARETLVRAVFSGAQKGAPLLWTKVTVRPVELKGEIHLQFSYFDEKKDITKNHLEDARSKVEELVALPFRNIFVESSDGNLQVNISKKGKAVGLVQREGTRARQSWPGRCWHHDQRRQDSGGYAAQVQTDQRIPASGG